MPKPAPRGVPPSPAALLQAAGPTSQLEQRSGGTRVTSQAAECQHYSLQTSKINFTAIH